MLANFREISRKSITFILIIARTKRLPGLNEFLKRLVVLLVQAKKSTQ